MKRLTTEQYIAIEWLAQPRKGGKTYDEVAELCGVDTRTLYNWRMDETFQTELKREMVRRSQDKLPELIDSLAEIAIRDGNAAMAKLALQINGILTDKVEVVDANNTNEIDYDALDEELERYSRRMQ